MSYTVVSFRSELLWFMTGPVAVAVVITVMNVEVPQNAVIS